MIVTGGCYTELCKMPDWEAVRGSGGRATIALAQLGCVVELRTYYSSDHPQRLVSIEMAGVTIRTEKRTADIAFSYLHPLATPHYLRGDGIAAEKHTCHGDGDHDNGTK